MSTHNTHKRGFSGVAAVISTTAFSAILWMLFARLFVPSLIANAYHGQSAPYFNSFISGQNVHPLSDYIVSWDAISLRVLIALLGCGIAAAVLVEPRVQEAVWGEEREREYIGGMTRLRMATIYAVIGVIAVGSVVTILRGAEYWPFSSYPMYSQQAQTMKLTQYRLYGVSESGQEFPLVDYRYTQPFDPARINFAFENLRARGGEKDIEAGLSNFMSRYEELRLEGKHHGPPLQAIRLYRVSWNPDPSASDVNHPEVKQLVGEAGADDDTL